MDIEQVGRAFGEILPTIAVFCQPASLPARTFLVGL